MIGAGVPTDVVRLIVINPKTGKPVARSTFWRRFKPEIDSGGKQMTAYAAETLACAMQERNADGTVTRAGIAATIFWLKTRESELFSERRINENIERKAADQLSKITDDEAIRIAKNVMQAATDNKAARENFGQPSVDDKPQGNA